MSLIGHPFLARSVESCAPCVAAAWAPGVFFDFGSEPYTLLHHELQHATALSMPFISLSLSLCILWLCTYGTVWLCYCSHFWHWYFRGWSKIDHQGRWRWWGQPRVDRMFWMTRSLDSSRQTSYLQPVVRERTVRSCGAPVQKLFFKMFKKKTCDLSWVLIVEWPSCDLSKKLPCCKEEEPETKGQLWDLTRPLEGGWIGAAVPCTCACFCCIASWNQETHGKTPCQGTANLNSSSASPKHWTLRWFECVSAYLRLDGCQWKSQHSVRCSSSL